MADSFDAFVLVVSAGYRGWLTATQDDVFNLLCFLDTQGKGTKMVHGAFCPGLAHAGEYTCLTGSSFAKRYAAEYIRKVLGPS